MQDQGIVHKNFRPSNLLICGPANSKGAYFDDMSDIKGTHFDANKYESRSLWHDFSVYRRADCLQQVRTVSFATDVYSWVIAVFALFAD